jgi:hypothetical protein
MAFTRSLSLTTTVCLFSSFQEVLLRTERSFYVEPAALADCLYLFSPGTQGRKDTEVKD